MNLAARFGDLDALRNAIARQNITGGSAEIANRFAAVAALETYDTGDVLITQDAADTDFFFVLLGSVTVSPNGRDDMVRAAHNHVGEMAAIDTAVRRSATVRVNEPTVVAKISEPEFTKIAEDYPIVWRRLAMELADRVRQRTRSVQTRRETPRVFIASSSEALGLAGSLKTALAVDPYEVKIWKDDGIFVPGMTNIEALEQELPRVDFAVLLLSPDDRVLSRWRWSRAPRDNLILELGLFIGAIGRRRAIMVHPRKARLKIPTDLLGVTPISYTNANMDAVAVELRTIIETLKSK
jgi:predicted nucleotide-binding protein